MTTLGMTLTLVVATDEGTHSSSDSCPEERANRIARHQQASQAARNSTGQSPLLRSAKQAPAGILHPTGLKHIEQSHYGRSSHRST